MRGGVWTWVSLVAGGATAARVCCDMWRAFGVRTSQPQDLRPHDKPLGSLKHRAQGAATASASLPGHPPPAAPGAAYAQPGVSPEELVDCWRDWFFRSTDPPPFPPSSLSLESCAQRWRLNKRRRQMLTQDSGGPREHVQCFSHGKYCNGWRETKHRQQEEEWQKEPEVKRALDELSQQLQGGSRSSGPTFRA
ncbi:hypothetical protein DUNSADRAFT_8794 [Dunaliella salina]|uniref:Uncharacterized protein n=1 Tax=Dunaliella salina TaxID=3046 RepID=A0ABQ7GIT6_DUNSA|nr:hypothetical protein DUNSADRAFT_8794 [Dunaliella salina]|eukprot:KAF5834501.1 hypothetical protein DUNSADRAFT_8794 [Dunaliella salina]